MSALMTTTAQQMKRIGEFVRDYGVPLMVLLLVAVADGMVRTIALAAFALVVIARLLLVLSDRVRRVAPAGPRIAHARRAHRGGTRR